MKKSTVVAAAFALHMPKTFLWHLKNNSTPDNYWIMEEQRVPKTHRSGNIWIQTSGRFVLGKKDISVTIFRKYNALMREAIDPFYWLNGGWQ